MLFTDPQRTPDPVAAAARLPRGAAVVYRHFGRADAAAVAARLAQVARSRGLVLLIGADWRLAAKVGAHGVHLPEALTAAARRLKAQHPDWIVTAAAHSAPATRKARAAGADAAIVSAIFPSRSPSAGIPLGALRLAAIVRIAGLPVYALGGVNEETARRLKDVGVTGFAAVEGLRT